MKNSTWSSRFTKKTDIEVLEFSESLSVDIVLYEADIRVTIAHVEMLSECKIIKKNESKKIILGLKKVKTLAETGKLPWSIDHEDVHMNIENALVKIIGDSGKKIPEETTRLLRIQKEMVIKNLIKFPDLYYAKSHFPLEISQRAFDHLWRMCESYELWCKETKQLNLIYLNITD